MIKNHSYITSVPEGQYSMEHTRQAYRQGLRSLDFQLNQASIRGTDPESLELARTLIDKAQEFDIQQAYHMTNTPYHGDIVRDLANPPSFSAPFLIGQVWADNPATFLEDGEEWNKGRRVTNTGIAYDLDAQGLPINPYMRMGVRDRGIIGRYAPNHAVDDGILRIMENKEGKPTLHTLGIIRQDNGLPALCGGFTNFTFDKGQYLYGEKEIIQTQSEEFFEELVSGSVELLPKYNDGLQQEIDDEIARRTKAQGREPNDRQKQVITNELTTHRKLTQVYREDPDFMRNVEKLFTAAKPCYSGPVVTSTRNTDSSWMETHLSWIMLDERTWSRTKGQDKFGYDFKAGDDAQDLLLWREITPELIDTATGSHDAFLAYMPSSYTVTQQEKNPDVRKAIKEQMEDLINYFPNINHVAKTAPKFS